MFEIGNSLREARLRKGIDFAEAEQTTKIRSKYLRALEEERFELLPAQTYVKGFLRSYADYLGLDGQLYVDEYNSRYVIGEDEFALRARRTGSSGAQRRVESRALVVALAGIAAVTALVFVAWKWGSPDEQQVRPPAVATSTTRKTVPPKVSGPRVANPGAERWLALDLRASRGDSWLIVRRGGAGGKLLFEGTLDRGQRMRFTGKTLWLNASVPRNLVARIDGRRVALPPSGAEPLVARVTRAGIAPVAAS